MSIVSRALYIATCFMSVIVILYGTLFYNFNDKRVEKFRACEFQFTDAVAAKLSAFHGIDYASMIDTVMWDDDNNRWFHEVEHDAKYYVEYKNFHDSLITLPVSLFQGYRWKGAIMHCEVPK